jgi:hypothetical protein
MVARPYKASLGADEALHKKMFVLDPDGNNIEVVNHHRPPR